VEDCLTRVDEVDSEVGAFITLCPDGARAEARLSEERWAKGAPRPLDGVPYGLKDIIATGGVRTTGGSRLYEDWIPSGSATVATRLADAGGVLMGKLQTFELAGAVPAGPLGTTRNPWGLERTSGGSSSGSAAALAARELPLAIGSDTGGSIRIPAAFCGISGLKPTYGLVSRHGVMARSWTLDHIGPMARSVEDLALCLAAIAGHDPLDQTSSRRALPGYRDDLERDVGGMRLGIPAEWAFSTCDPEVEARTRDALAVLREAGAEIVEVRLPNTEEHALDQLSRIISGAESASAHEDNLDRLDGLSELASQRLLANLTITAVDYLRAMRLRHLVQLDFESMFEEVDAVIAPTTAAVAPRLDDGLAQVGARSLPWLEIAAGTTSVGNLAGIPALAIPAGFSRAGLPIGIQVMARPFAETTCFRVGAAFQALTDHHLQVPPLTAAIKGAQR